MMSTKDSRYLHLVYECDRATSLKSNKDPLINRRRMVFDIAKLIFSEWDATDSVCLKER